MTPDCAPADLTDCTADERLLDGDLSALPAAVGRPEPVPVSRVRGRLVGAGATLTGLTLLGGIALIALGVIDAAANGVSLRDGGAVVLGLALVGTHWGWVHVAEAAADALERRRVGAAHERRLRWLATIEPYARHEVTTRVDDAGAIHIVRTCHRPVRTGAHHFTFVRDVAGDEVHCGDAPAAVVAERAELLRRQAALATEHEHERFQAAADARQATLWDRDDEQRRLAERRATSQAVSDQINAGLRDPPLTG